MRRNITCKKKQLIIYHFTKQYLARPYFSYCILAWRPYRKDIDKLDKIYNEEQLYKLIPELRHLPYENRLIYFNIEWL